MPSSHAGSSWRTALGIPFTTSTPTKAELLFRHKRLWLLRDKDLITQERIDLLLSWKNPGFGVHNHTTVYFNDTEGLHKLAGPAPRPAGRGSIEGLRREQPPETRVLVGTTRGRSRHGDS
jgi:hypothetical protein